MRRKKNKFVIVLSIKFSNLKTKKTNGVSLDRIEEEDSRYFYRYLEGSRREELNKHGYKSSLKRG